MRAKLVVLSIVLCAAMARADGPDIQRVPEAFTYMGAPKVLPNAGRPAQKIPFPDIANWGSLKITLERGECMGTCPAYRVEIHGDGEVRFEGSDYVLLSGVHTARISRDAVHVLFAKFREADFFWLGDKYESTITDFPPYRLSISYDGHSKSVSDYVGEQVGMPKSVIALENAVDDAAGTQRWIHGGSDPIAQLKAEGWNFGANDDGHTILLRTAAAARRNDLVRDLLAAGVPTRNRMGCLAATEAARSGDADTFRRLLTADAPLHWRDKNRQDECDVFHFAVQCASPEILRLTVEQHPALVRENWSALSDLADAAQDFGGGTSGDYAACGKLLIAAGADVNWRDKNGVSALMRTSDAGLLGVLLAAGARDLNAQDWRGQTVLFNAHTPKALEVVLTAGADPSLRDKDGRTALDEALFSGDTEKAGFLKDWTTKHPPPLH